MSESYTVDELMAKLPFPKICDSCAHKSVCKNYQQAEIMAKNKCDDYMSDNSPKTYGNIYNMFEPVFQWIEANYPSEDVRFVVNKNGAQMFIQHGPVATCKALQSNFNFCNNESDRTKSAAEGGSK